MTFKDLQKLVQSQIGPEQSQLLKRLRDKPFWIWDQQQHKKESVRPDFVNGGYDGTSMNDHQNSYDKPNQVRR